MKTIIIKGSSWYPEMKLYLYCPLCGAVSTGFMEGCCAGLETAAKQLELHKDRSYLQKLLMLTQSN